MIYNSGVSKQSILDVSKAFGFKPNIEHKPIGWEQSRRLLFDGLFLANEVYYEKKQFIFCYEIIIIQLLFVDGYSCPYPHIRILPGGCTYHILETDGLTSSIIGTYQVGNKPKYATDHNGYQYVMQKLHRTFF